MEARLIARCHRILGTARLRLGAALVGVAAVCLTPALEAQTEYRNTESGRPLRIEDAAPTELHALELQVTPVRLEHLDASHAYRWQVEPRLSYGVLPRTEFTLRLPIVYREAAASPRAGVSGLGVGAFHNLNLESLGLPAFSFGGEILLPVSAASAGSTTGLVKAVATRSFAFGRVHVNATYGSYTVRVPATAADSQPATPFIPEAPCDVAPVPGVRAGYTRAGVAHVAPDPRPGRARRRGVVVGRGTRPPIGPAFCELAASLPFAAAWAAPAAQVSQAATPPPTAVRSYWSAGLAADRALALRSLLFAADVFAERFGGFGRSVDWTAEAGGRKQLTPRIVVDAGLGRHFAGLNRSWFVTFGTTLTFATLLGVTEP